VRRFDTVFQNIQVVETTINFPSVPSNGSVFFDVAVTLAQGTEVISFAPITDATSLDDLVIQVFVPVTDVLRFTLFNPTAGAIDPDSIDWRVVTGIANSELAVVV